MCTQEQKNAYIVLADYQIAELQEKIDRQREVIDALTVTGQSTEAAIRTLICCSTR